MLPPSQYFFFFFFNDTATTEIYTLSLHDALPIFSAQSNLKICMANAGCAQNPSFGNSGLAGQVRSEEHTSELQSRLHLVCRLLLEKKKKKGHCRISGRRILVNSTKRTLEVLHFMSPLTPHFVRYLF